MTEFETVHASGFGLTLRRDRSKANCPQSLFPSRLVLRGADGSAMYAGILYSERGIAHPSPAPTSAGHLRESLFLPPSGIHSPGTNALVV